MVINMILINDLKKKIGPSKDYKFKEFIIDRQKVHLIYNEVLTSKTNINNQIIKNYYL